MSDQAEMRATIARAARGWIDTPYRHAADIKGAGVDCGMLLVRVFVDLGLVAPFDPRPYTHDWMLHRSEERFLSAMLERATAVETPDIGDIGLWLVGRCYSHGGIVVETKPLTIVHAVLKYRRVVEEIVDTSPFLASRLKDVRFASVIGAA